MKDNDMPEVAYLWKHNGIWLWGVEDELKYASHKYILADTSISLSDIPEGCTPADAKMLRKANHDLVVEHERIVSKCLNDIEGMELTVKEEQDKHKAQLQELEKDLLMNIKGTDGRQIIREAFKGE